MKVRRTIFRLCSFFNEICQRVVDKNKIETLEEEIIETMCMLEKYFPPSFFDIMIHLTIHLGREVRLCGPVQYRWMYPFERYYDLFKVILYINLLFIANLINIRVYFSLGL